MTTSNTNTNTNDPDALRAEISAFAGDQPPAITPSGG